MAAKNTTTFSDITTSTVTLLSSTTVKLSSTTVILGILPPKRTTTYTAV